MGMDREAYLKKIEAEQKKWASKVSEEKRHVNIINKRERTTEKRREYHKKYQADKKHKLNRTEDFLRFLHLSCND